jgi:hypothetical protein
MTTQALPRGQEPLYGIAPEDAETIIHELGMRLIDACNEAHAERVTAGSKQSPWGSMQREQLLRALITEVGRHARVCKNAALSTTEAGLAEFARKTFKNGQTRSPRDRKPITQNVDKVIGGWLRQWSRWLRLDRLERIFQRGTLVDWYSGDVQLRERRATFRLTLTLGYPWRVTVNRRLRITVKLEELEPGKAARVLPFPSNANADAVALPEERSARLDEAQMLEGQLDHVIALARMFQQHRLADSLSATRRTFLKYDARKITAALLLLVTISVAASPAGRKFVARVVDAIVSSGSLRDLLEKLRVDPKEGVFVTPGGARSPVAVSGSGSEVRLSPGASPELMHIESSISDKDFSQLMELMVPLSDVGRVGVNAVQYREAAHEPIVPWVIEVLVAPEQDAELAAELAARNASISIRYDPPLPKPDLARLQDVSLAGKRVTMASELRELPHVQQTYAVTATVMRESGTSHVYRAQLNVDAKGLATLQRERGDPITAVSQDVKVGHPICTTILHEQTYPLNNPGQMDYVWALANMHEEQRAILFVHPLSKSPWVDEITVDWGDGGKADQQKQKGLFTVAHTYRVGDRAYPITIYFKGSDVVYKFDLFVFKGRGPARGTSVVEYVTPYPPNPEVTSLTEMKSQDPGEVFVSMRQGPVTSESITFSLFHEPWAWAVRISRRTGPRVDVRYVWRDGEVVELPSVSPRSR